eukprot:GAHX01005163.1.p1 GENE.GAHX01005163.1~~GAHX01005163.1.p1  ORF type:complete len:57 (-),score=5.15 GAHX01005163.1:144-314(-)
MYCKSRKKCITNKFIEEINNSSPQTWSASILHNTCKPLKYMHTPFCSDEKRFCGDF